MLGVRPTQPSELSQIVPLLPDYSIYDPGQLAALAAFWRDILERGGGHSSVVFHPERPRRILAFGISCFIDTTLAAKILEYREPFVARALLEQWRDGRAPFLFEEQVARANAAGDLIALITHSAYPAVQAPPSDEEIRYASSQSFVGEHRGLNLRGVIAECFTVRRAYALQRGAKIVECRDLYATAVRPGGQRSFLGTMMRDDMALDAGNFLTNALFYEFSPPRLRLDRAQRELLKYALVNDNDAWLAEQLGISPSAVKKRWLTVYDAVWDRQPHLAPQPWLVQSGQRGPEKRRHVLRYIREHREELHPYDPSAALLAAS